MARKLSNQINSLSILNAIFLFTNKKNTSRTGCEIVAKHAKEVHRFTLPLKTNTVLPIASFCGFSKGLRTVLPGLHFGPSTRLELEKAIAPHSSTLAWKMPWTEEPARLQSRGSLRVGHN